MYRDVTPKSFRRRQAKRNKKLPTAMKQAFDDAKIREVREEIARIERKIADMNTDPECPPERIKAWQESWQFHQSELMRLNNRAA